MTGHSQSDPPETAPAISRWPATIGPIGERILRWVLFLIYAALLGLLAILAGTGAVYAGALLPTTFGTVVLRWLLAVVLIAASPTIAMWLMRRVFSR